MRHLTRQIHCSFWTMERGDFIRNVFFKTVKIHYGLLSLHLMLNIYNEISLYCNCQSLPELTITMSPTVFSTREQPETSRETVSLHFFVGKPSMGTYSLREQTDSLGYEMVGNIAYMAFVIHITWHL